MPNTDRDREQAAQGALILNRLVPAPDHGAGFRRDPETGFVYYSSEWLDDTPYSYYCECGATITGKNAVEALHLLNRHQSRGH